MSFHKGQNGPLTIIQIGPGNTREEASGEVDAGLQQRPRDTGTAGQGAAVSGRQRARGGTLFQDDRFFTGLADVTRKVLLGQ